MKKLLLVVFMGMALVMNLYGIVNDFMVDDVKEVNHIEETTMIVYEE